MSKMRGTAGHTLTRTEVAMRLGLSTSSVRRLEGVQLHPIQDDRGVWRFDRTEVERMPVRARPKHVALRRRETPSAGQIAARVFRMFDAGHELSDIVIAARQPPALVRQLYREWLIGLEQGERDRQARDRSRQDRESRERERRERAEEDRAHREWMRTIAR